MHTILSAMVVRTDQYSSADKKWGFPKIRVTILGVPIIIPLFWETTKYSRGGWWGGVDFDRFP